MDHRDDEPTSVKNNVQEAGLWQKDGWTAKVVKNDDDEGWAVEITLEGNVEPVLVAPWTMGRDKKNPKPLDVNSFHTWIKTAAEVLGRHRQQLHASLNKTVQVEVDGKSIRFELAITPSEDPYGTLKAIGRYGEELGLARVPANFKLSPATARDWASLGFKNIHSD